MKIKPPNFKEIEYIKGTKSVKGFSRLANEILDEKMTEEEMNIYEQQYNEFSEKYSIGGSLGGAGKTIKSNPAAVTPYKLYMNPGVDSLKFAELIINKCKEKGMDYTIKVMTPEEVNKRCERLIVYGTSAENINELYDLLDELIKENDSINFGKPPILTGYIDGKIGFGYDKRYELALGSSQSYNTWMPKILTDNQNMFFESLKNKIPKEYYNVHGQLDKGRVIKDFPEILDELVSSMEEAYKKAIKDIPGIEQLVDFDISDKNKGEELENKAKNKAKNKENIKEKKTTDYTVENLPKGAKWRQSSRGDYNLVITGEDGSRRTYSAEVASKKFGVKVPEQEPIVNNLPEGAKWRQSSRGDYNLVITEKDGSRRTYSAEVASRKYGVNPPNYMEEKSDSKLPIAKDPKGSVGRIAKGERGSKVKGVTTEMKETYRGEEKPTVRGPEEAYK